MSGTPRSGARRTRPPLRPHPTLVALLAAGILAGGAAAQAAAPRAPGWIGFWYELVPARGGGTAVVVDRVEPGSPAARAGLGRGDTLLAVDGTALSPAAFRAMGQRLRVGDAVRLTVRGEGRRRDLQVTAAARPRGLAVTLEVMTDSAHRVLLDDMDSLRVHALLAPPAAPRAPRVVRAEAPPPPGPSGVRLRGVEAVVADGLSEPLPDAGRGQPFTVFVWSAADSLLDSLRALEAEEREARAAESRRLRELAAAVGPGGRVNAADPALVAHRRRLDAVRARAEEVRRRVEEAARDRALEAAAAAPAMPFRPMTPYLVGQDRAAGARLTPLNPGLAPYFGTARGLLVVEVAEGTPAHEAGLLPGDVLLGVAGAEVAGMDDLRAALGSSAARPVPLRVLRKGRVFDARLP